MIVTVRQLEDLHRQNGGNGHIALPQQARLTPLASDWVRARKIVLGYADASSSVPSAAPARADAPAPAREQRGSFLWWCDGPCGPAKAAVVAYERESTVRALDKPADVSQLVPVLKTIHAQVKSASAAGAVLFVQNGAKATVLANRCPSLRAILGTSLEAVEQGIRQAAANVLIIETPRNTLQQVKNLLSRFVRGTRALPDELERELRELASCG